ncbi:hypothetical protein VTH06DRAFT_867 [Thermothelomyces fergusii]
MLDEILTVLRNDFSQYPPHTIQRLAELVLRPRQHYRHLVPYLHALDRVVHVTSGANAYPLPPALPDLSAMSLLANGAGGGGGGAGSFSNDTTAASTLGSDEALGGALLTPIPWLAGAANGSESDEDSNPGGSSPLAESGNQAQQRQLQQQQQQQQQQLQQQRQNGHLDGRVRTESTETIEGPNGIGSIETVSVSVNGIPSAGAGIALVTQRSVTQGELLRQEQRAGLVPLSQLNRQQRQASAQAQQAEDAPMTDAAGPGEDDEDEVPHARGPQEIGPADTGPQSPATASYIAGAAGSPVDVQGIDVAAAVGRTTQSPPSQHEPGSRAGGSPEGGEIVPRSPKREAGGPLEPESPAKRRREGEQAAASPTGKGHQGRDQAGSPEQQQQQQQRRRHSGQGAGRTLPDESEAKAEEPKRDVEKGDASLSDAGDGARKEEPLAASRDAAAAAAVAASPDAGGGTPSTSKSQNDPGPDAEEKQAGG